MIDIDISEQEFKRIWEWLIETRNAHVFKSALASFDQRALKIGDDWALTSHGFPPDQCKYRCREDLYNEWEKSKI